MLDRNADAFFALVRAGLWSDANNISASGSFEGVNWSEVQKLAEEQSVVGLVAAGIDVYKMQVPGFKIAKTDALQFIGQTLQLEQRNQAMDYFISVLVEKMRAEEIYTLLVKGQGIAQCYAKPEWRASGDVDFLLSENNYEKAKSFLTPLAASVETEYKSSKHLGMTIDPWVVELHGSLRCGISHRMNKELDEIYNDTFHKGEVRTWNNNGVQVFLLKEENDIFYVFSHFLNHFYKEGLGIRQVCDWCRLIWNCRNKINDSILEQRLRKSGLTTVWKAFAAFAVDYLGMPAEAMPLYDVSKKWKNKAKRIKSFVMESGNFGQNRDSSYFGKYPYLVRKAYSMGRRMLDLVRHARIFPCHSMRFFPYIMFNGIRSAIRGE